MGLIKGEYGGRSDDFLPGGASYECGFVPHGVDNDVFEAASNIEQSGAQWISDGCYAFMFESSCAFTVTDWALNKSGTAHFHDVETWDKLKPEFLDRLDEVDAHLAELGLPKVVRKL